MKDTQTAIQHIRSILKNKLPSKQTFHPYQPQQHWFLLPTTDIHGIKHATRVMIWQEIIAQLLSRQHNHTIDHEALRWSAAIHDTQRYDDMDDFEHGIRAAQWAEKNFQHLPQHTLSTIKYITTWHVPHDHEAPQITTELAIFKDADALDRARSSDLDTSFLRHNVTKKVLINVAQELFTQSNKQQTVDPFNDVLNAAVELGIITK